MAKTVKLENPVQLAVVGAAHGIKGEVRVKSFAEDPLALGRYGPLHTESGQALKVKDVRPAKNVVIVRFEGVSDRSAAEALTGQALYVDRSALPDQLEEEEFYHADLIGLPALDETGEKVGKVLAIHDFGAGDVLEIRPDSGPSVMVPFTREAVPEIDFEEGVIRLDSLAAGLGEDGEEAPGEDPDPPAPSEPSAPPRGPKPAGGDR